MSSLHRVLDGGNNIYAFLNHSEVARNTPTPVSTQHAMLACHAAVEGWPQASTQLACGRLV